VKVAPPIEVLRSTQSHQAVGVCELCKDPNFITVLKLQAAGDATVSWHAGLSVEFKVQESASTHLIGDAI